MVPVTTNEGEHWNVIVYTNDLRFGYSIYVSLIVFLFSSSICYGSLIVVCEAIATLVFYLWGCVRFTVCCSEVNSKFFCYLFVSVLYLVYCMWLFLANLLNGVFTIFYVYSSSERLWEHLQNQRWKHTE